MKYLRQLLIILGITFVGEVLNYVLPLPIPASIYGLALMLILLCTGVLKVSSVKETSQFLLDVMPLMFIPAAAGVVREWGIIKPILIPTVIMMTVVTVIVMAVTGLVTQLLINIRRKGKEKNVH
ncbi:MAG: CidA/LrgA family protein [Clostridia bacterium]|nr:CidA/LrgA family protein [Clostridia bacterium]